MCLVNVTQQCQVKLFHGLACSESVSEDGVDCFLNFKPGDGKMYPIELLSKINRNSLFGLLRLI